MTVILLRHSGSIAVDCGDAEGIYDDGEKLTVKK